MYSQFSHNSRTKTAHQNTRERKPKNSKGKLKMAIKDKPEDRLEWNVDVEVQLFYAMRGHKPVGVNRHFQMACILEKFRNSVQKDITSQQIWDHLETMYDMGALHESEILPFPNEELEFILPDTDFGQLIKQDEKVRDSKAKEDRTKESEKETKDEKERETPTTKSTKGAKSKHHHHHHHHSSHDHSHETKEAVTPKSSATAKSASKEKHKELKDAHSAENSPKRKRAVRGNHAEHASSKSSSPASKEPTPKRRRT